MKKIKVLACKVMMRELYSLAYKSENIVDIGFLRQGLHDEPKRLHRELQEAIDATEREEEQYDAICIGYGLCSNGIVGLRASKTTLVVPRAHDCIALLLGSRHKYSELFASKSGIYWYSPGWLEHNRKGMPGPDRLEHLREEYTRQFDEDTAQLLIETELEWMSRYGHAVFVDWEEFENTERCAYTQTCAKFLGWEYTYEKGSPALLRSLLEGDWPNEDFLVVPPGKSIEPSYGEDVIKLDLKKS